MKKRGRFFLIFVVVLNCSVLSGQKQAGVWYFGRRAGLDFNVDPPAALTDGSLDTEEGCATVCTKEGDLLFYTDGVTVYNKNHAVMANGSDLNGHFSATQSSIIVQKPLSNKLYYIFTVDAHQNFLINGLNYSVVDISLNGGLGEVISKNVAIYGSEVCEKITAVLHANGRDFWILTHLWNSRDFHAYLFSETGISAPVVSAVGSVHNAFRQSAIGYMKTSAKGNKLAVALFTEDAIEVFDFNSLTGEVTNPIQLGGYVTPYGIEFSPSSIFLYVSSFSDGEVYQFNTTVGNVNAMKSSAKTVATSLYVMGSLQLAPDKKIYVAKNNNFNTGVDYLDVIESPDAEGNVCDYVEDGKFLDGSKSMLGLPNFLTSIFNLRFAYQFECEGDNTEFFIISDTTGIVDAFWNFGDGNTTTVTTPPFGAVNVFPSVGDYRVKLDVNFSGGGQDSVSYLVSIVPAPTANDQNIVVWEDSKGSGIASGIDLTQQEASINGNAGIVYVWYSDFMLTTTVPNPTNVIVSNGTQFFVTVGSGSCINTAQVIYTVKSLPIANDQDIELCEDSEGSGTVAGVDLTALESLITGGSGLSVNWYHDISTTQLVNQPENRVVQNGEVFYAEVVDGTVSNTAVITYTLLVLPESVDVSVQVLEDSYLSGTASGINLNYYNLSVNPSGENVTWYADYDLITPISDPTNVTVSNNDIFYAEIDNGVCVNRGSVQFTVRARPIANDLSLELCEDVEGSGAVVGVNLTLLNDTINGGTNNPVSWFLDPALTTQVPNPTNITVTNGENYYAQVSYQGNTNIGIISYTVRQLPVAVDQNPREFEDAFGTYIALGVDLTQQNLSITQGQSYSVAWFLDANLINPVPDPTNRDVANGDVFYASVNDGRCINTAVVRYTVLPAPVAYDVNEIVCEDTEGSGNASNIDLTQLENRINEGNGDQFQWYYDWLTKPLGLPINLIPDPTNITVGDKDEYYATVSNALNTNVATVTYQVLTLPTAIDQQVFEWESNLGSETAYGVNLLALNDDINGQTGSSVTWYTDSSLNIPVATPQNITVLTGDIYYAKIDDGMCENSAKATFTVSGLPRVNNLVIEMCEDELGSLKVDDYDLTQLNNQVNNDPLTAKIWFADLALTQQINNPGSITVSDGDSFFVEVSLMSESNTGRVSFTVKPLPNAKNVEVEFCESAYMSGADFGIDLTAMESEITTESANVITWYSDSAYQQTVRTPKNVTVIDDKKFYALIWNGSCTNKATVTYQLKNLPLANSGIQQLCEDSEGSGQVVGFDLIDFSEQVNPEPENQINWYADDRYITEITNPTNITITENSQYFAKVTKDGCSNTARWGFRINSLPKSLISEIRLCEEEKQILKYNLKTQDTLVAKSPDEVIRWYEDPLLEIAVQDINQYEILDNSVLFALISNGTCDNISQISFVVNEQPTLKLGADTTIYFFETKTLNPNIEARFLPGDYLWQDQSTQPAYTVTKAGVYWVQFTDINGCIAADTIIVDVLPYKIEVPNAFTPNGDGTNDLFKPEISGDIIGLDIDIDMYIYNRWGELIHEFTDIGIGWDGTYKGNVAPIGVYVWIILVDGKAVKDGSVSLIK